MDGSRNREAGAIVVQSVGCHSHLANISSLRVLSVSRLHTLRVVFHSEIYYFGFCVSIYTERERERKVLFSEGEKLGKKVRAVPLRS